MTDSSSQVWLDHFVVAIGDLAAGVASFEDRTGVRPQIGGEHPALGTHNALVSLGPDRYFEILAPRPGASLSPLFGAAAGHETLTPIMWAVATDDVHGARDRLVRAGFAVPEPAAGSRTTTEGEQIRWTMFMLGEGSPRGAPFVVEWDPETRHPATTTPPGCELESFGVVSPDSDAVSDVLGALGFECPVSAGAFRLDVRIRTPRGVVDFGLS